MKQELNAVLLLSLTLPLVRFEKYRLLAETTAIPISLLMTACPPYIAMRAMSAFIPADYFLVSFGRH